MKTKTDREFAEGMAKDIVKGINFYGAGRGFRTSELLHRYLDSIAVAGEYPCRCNYDDNGRTPGVWTWFDPAGRYDIDYPAFNEVLEAKLPGFEFTDPEESKDPEEEPDAPVTLDDCIELFDALNDIYAEAIKIVYEWIDNEPETHFAEVMKNAFTKES